ncbi:Uncharacterised protein [Serratia rubidaea]|nr:Uncharacterised protein [Serratia rubidaea]
MLRYFGLMDISEQEWASMFADMQRYILDAQSKS